MKTSYRALALMGLLTCSLASNITYAGYARDAAVYGFITLTALSYIGGLAAILMLVKNAYKSGNPFDASYITKAELEKDYVKLTEFKLVTNALGGRILILETKINPEAITGQLK
jgi:uncharacterized membrane-anchored protein